jgi:photosystem II stability/assembly factor-like uncharacterized protein
MLIIKNTSLVVLFTIVSALTALGQWTPATSGTTRNLNGVHLLDSGVGLSVGDSGTILKTTDAGATWNALVSGTTKTLHDVYLFDENTGIAVGDSGLILRTTDGGLNWTSVASGVRDSLLAVSFSGASGICGGNSQDILYSNDSGATWHVSQKGFFGGGFLGAQMISSTEGFVAGSNSIFQPFLGTTTDGGMTWTFHPFYFDSNEGGAEDVFFFDANTGLVSGGVFDGRGALARTTNGGVDWTTSFYSGPTHGIDFATAASGFVVGASGSILHSTDAGMTWAEQESGTSAELFDVDFESDGLVGIAVGAGGTIVRTTDGGAAGDFALMAAGSRVFGFTTDLPLSGSPGVESRDGGAHHHYVLIFTFNHSVSSVEGAETSCGRVGRGEIDPNDDHRVFVSLTGADCDESDVVVTLDGVQDDQGGTITTASATMKLLVGDVDGDGSVTQADVRLAESSLRQKARADNFRADVNSNGRINGADVKLVKAKIGK